MSDITKKYIHLYRLFQCLSLIILIVPLLVYGIKGFIEGAVGEKFTLGITITIAAILVALNILFKYRIRSTIWIVVLGIYVAVDNILPLLLCVAIGTIVDEFILTPLAKHYKSKASINKEIDKRME